ncbi:bifunctional 2-polyprenyl-6-hydroxyphenol methylase/3-demethylubiquinol 3-O-methyltransferase UbiG [Paenibacillus sp. FSL H7-0331]|uniref:class I SAM-dependent methyltransferase n=1 Tax=Paenibacillus sp. FSL H7-0331 TaxID=1920421 RepID=UPI00096DCECF|nr:class I SAM-dependent methyltransferase [Paenibacillus sp. FSL H7-0331]OMF08616.1 SAM-dependent methyltransferase [Paenibacillus sp. FSL H7-0331]
MNRIVKYYETFDEWGRLDREPLEFNINWHFIQQYLPGHGAVLDNGAGPGKYALKLAQLGYKVTLTDLTPKLVELARAKAEHLSLLEQFTAFEVADATDLSRFTDGQFAASLMLGPLYHLQQEADRVAAVQELNRVTEMNGVVFVAFMPRVRHVLSSLLSPTNWKPHDEAAAIIRFMETGTFDHQDEGRFTGAYYYNIEEIQPFMETQGFETLKIIGSSNIGSLLSQAQWNYWRERGDEEIEKIFDIFLRTAENPYVLGASSHILYIGRKKYSQKCVNI